MQPNRVLQHEAAPLTAQDAVVLAPQGVGRQRRVCSQRRSHEVGLCDEGSRLLGGARSVGREAAASGSGSSESRGADGSSNSNNGRRRRSAGVSSRKSLLGDAAVSRGD